MDQNWEGLVSEGLLSKTTNVSKLFKNDFKKSQLENVSPTHILYMFGVVPTYCNIEKKKMEQVQIQGFELKS